MVSKQIQPYWYLQQLVDAEVRRLAPDAAVAPVVMYDDEKIQRLEDCPGVNNIGTEEPSQACPARTLFYSHNRPLVEMVSCKGRLENCL